MIMIIVKAEEKIRALMQEDQGTRTQVDDVDWVQGLAL